MFSSYKRVFWLSVVMSLFVYVPFYVTGFSTDVWTRLARISEWVANGFPLKEHLLMSQNYPFGFELHWTRPLDYIGYIGAWPFIPNWGMKGALEIMAHYVPVLIMLLAVRGFFFGLKGYLTPKMAFLSFWLFFFGIGHAWGQGAIGYFDHHIFHFTILVWSIALIARSFRLKNNKKYIITAGIISGVGTWMTPEFFINSYLLMAPFVWGWFWQNKSLKPAIIYTTSYTILLTIAMTFDHPMDGFFTFDFARTSLFHAILGGLNLLIFSLLSWNRIRKNKGCRLIYGMLLILLMGMVLLFGFSDVLLTPMVDPMMYHIWTKKVTEMRPLYEDWVGLLIYAILPLLLAFSLLFWCILTRHQRQIPLVLMGIVGTFFYATMMIFHVRVGVSQSAYFIFLGSCYLNITFFPREKSFRRSLIFMIFYLLFIGAFSKGHAALNRFKVWGVGRYLEQYKNDPDLKVPDYLKDAFDKAIADEKAEEETQKNDPKNGANVSQNTSATKYVEDEKFSCSGNEKLWEKIKGIKSEGAIFTDIFMAPEVYWETGKPVLGGPYDRNIQGILDLTMIEWDGAPYDKAYELLKKHHVDLLFLQNPKCLSAIYYDDDKKDYKPNLDHYFHGAVYYETKAMPRWLKLEYWDKKTNIKVFRIIDPPAGKKKKL
ncbi:MAG: hypothetical protein SPL08_04810 [Pseudomonadota bacterium]|nr:hypothetical protein [Pseudomonadota bacterium]